MFQSPWFWSGSGVGSYLCKTLDILNALMHFHKTNQKHLNV
jgi:hypothetical protein